MGKIHCYTRKNILSEIVNSSKTYSSNLSLTFDYMFYPPRIDLEPRLTVRKPITSPVLSSTLSQIYCIGFIGPISYSIWVWAINCNPTNSFFLFPRPIILSPYGSINYPRVISRPRAWPTSTIRCSVHMSTQY